MTHERRERDKMDRARALASELARHSRGVNQEVAEKLCKLLEPPPSLHEILMQIPAEDHRERIRAIGISHQGYYNLMNGVSRPNTKTAARLAKLTGLPVDTIRQAGP